MSLSFEFKEFAIKRNMIDMVVGITVGAVFCKVVDSPVKDIVMPFVGMLPGGMDFKHRYINLGKTSYETVEAAK
jgi:large conductance mechanosensitive channel